jgi:hypothetical protein
MQEELDAAMASYGHGHSNERLTACSSSNSLIGAIHMTKLYLIDEAAGILDEVQVWFLAKADNEGWVYTAVLRQLTNCLYRDRDYQAKWQKQGRHTAYDYALDRDQKALAWAICALVQHVPPQEKQRPEPPRPPKKPARRLPPAQRRVYKGRSSWNPQPKRDWDGRDLPPDLPPVGEPPPIESAAEAVGTEEKEEPDAP